MMLSTESLQVTKGRAGALKQEVVSLFYRDSTQQANFFLCLGDYVSHVWYVVRNQATDEKAALDFPWARISLEKDESTRVPPRRRGAESIATTKESL
jgi:hypothetical protein